MTNIWKILIVDDDADVRESLVEHFALHDGIEAVAVETGIKGVQVARAGHVDLVIMDVGLPDMDGREAVRILRKSGFTVPIIMLTGNDTDSDAILGFEAGANDYVVKPFQFAVLLARIRVQLRQHEASEDAVFTIGHCTFNPRSKQLIDPNGCKRRLTQQEREALLQEIWCYNPSVTTHTLETHIYRLRRKVEKDASNPSVLVTVGGAYKLLA